MKKERVRYITIRFIGSQEVSEKDAWFIVATEVKRLFGVTGATKVGLYLSYFDSESQGGIFRVSHKAIQQVRAALCFIHSHHSQPLFVYSEQLTGSLRKAKKELQIEENLSKYHKMKQNLLNR